MGTVLASERRSDVYALPPRERPVLISNYDPRNLGNSERQRLDEIASRQAENFVRVDVRTGYPGGDFPVFGALKLRSLFTMLDFVAKSRAPEGSDRRIKFQGRYYTVGDTRWDRAAFMVLYELFQVTVTDVSRVGIPITIAK